LGRGSIRARGEASSAFCRIMVSTRFLGISCVITLYPALAAIRLSSSTIRPLAGWLLSTTV
jgi:hypothetical protein